MNVQILSRELVKPSTPTPPSLKNYKISLIDELAPTMNTPLIMYFPSPKNISASNYLKQTLAATLNPFYVLAGRYVKDSHTVDCSDQGAEFVQAKVDIRLTYLLDQRTNLKVELLNNLIPIPLGAVDEITDPLLAIQVTIFDCAGLTIGVCASHRIADLSTISTFLSEWANVTASWGTSGISPTSPSFDTPLFFPGKNTSAFPLGLPRSKENIHVHKIVTKIFYFDNKAISSIKGDATRVQCVFGIIWKALVDVNKVMKNGQLSDFIIIQPVNMRGKTLPPFPTNSCGNLYMTSLSKYVSSEKEMEFQDFANLLSNSVKSTVEDCAKILLCGEEGEMLLINPVVELNNFILSKPGMVNACFFTSWCRYPFYEVDFGWGNPIWVSGVNIPIANSVLIIDDKEGQGIEAWVNLEEKDVNIFKEKSIIKRLAPPLGETDACHVLPS